MSIKINVHEIRETKSGQVCGSLVFEPTELALPPPNDLWRTFTFNFACTNAGDLYILEGDLSSLTVQQCCRCLTPVEIPFEVKILEQFCRNGAGASDEDCFQFFGDEIPIDEALRENIILNLPVKPLCSIDCKGLCPQCGADLNKRPCNCRADEIDPRLAALKGLISK